MNLNSEDFNILKPSKRGGGGGDGPLPPKPENTEPWPIDDEDDDNDDDNDGEGKPGKPKPGKPKPGEGDYSVDAESFGEPISATPGGIITREQSRQIQKDLGVEEKLPVMTKDQIKDKIRKALAEEGAFGKESKRGEKGLGGGLGIDGYRAAIAEIARGKVNWKRLLRKFIGSKKSGSRSVLGNRRWLHSGAYMPTRQEKKKDIGSVVCSVDVSGSMSDTDILIILTEIKHLVKARGIDNTTIIYFHSQIERIVELKSKEAVAKYQMPPVRKGGTSFKEPLSAMERYKKDGKLELGVFLTDGEPNTWDNISRPTYLKDFIWVILNNPAMTPPWGNQVVYINSDDLEQS